MNCHCEPRRGEAISYIDRPKSTLGIASRHLPWRAVPGKSLAMTLLALLYLEKEVYGNTPRRTTSRCVSELFNCEIRMPFLPAGGRVDRGIHIMSGWI